MYDKSTAERRGGRTRTTAVDLLAGGEWRAGEGVTDQSCCSRSLNNN